MIIAFLSNYFCCAITNKDVFWVRPFPKNATKWTILIYCYYSFLVNQKKAFNVIENNLFLIIEIIEIKCEISCFIIVTFLYIYTYTSFYQKHTKLFILQHKMCVLQAHHANKGILWPSLYSNYHHFSCTIQYLFIFAQFSLVMKMIPEKHIVVIFIMKKYVICLLISIK